MMLEFSYNNGRGNVRLNLEEIFPCSAADMKRVISFVDLAADPEEQAVAIYNYLAGRVADLKKEREQHDENSAVGKEKITRINAQLKKHLANVAALVKRYNLPEITDNAAQIVLHAATVYAIEDENGEKVVKAHDGWTFEKAGYTFDVYKESKAYYRILFHGTGLSCASARNKGGAPAEITPRVLEALKKGTDKIAGYCEAFNKLMIAAGYLEADERPEIISTEETKETNNNISQEVNTMSDYSFTAETMTCKGKTFSAEYNITADGVVLVFVIIAENKDGRRQKQRIHFEPDHPDHPAALEAAKAFQEAHPNYFENVRAGKVKRIETISTGYTLEATPDGNKIKEVRVAEQVQEAAKAFENIPVIDTATGETVTDNAAEIIAETVQEAPAPETPAADPKAARGPVPKKTFIGETIKGNGWKIVFDGEKSRTRIIFDELPTEAAAQALQEAGFYYSAIMDSWNKKLTFKAYRAATALSGKLSELYAA